jgi:type II secretory ATPase GspE/PulE/Tfp pilus assembly ATPase PilB-like protein
MEAIVVLIIFVCATVAFVFTTALQNSEYDKKAKKDEKKRKAELAQRKALLKDQLEYVIKYFPLIIDDAIRQNQDEAYIESLRDTLKIARQVDENMKMGW